MIAATRVRPDRQNACRSPISGEGLETIGEAPHGLDVVDWLHLTRSVGELRLPSEEEWEYACRAGTITRFAAGDRNQDLLEMGLHRANSGGGTGDVASMQPNAWGLYDMHGNVWEWCASRRMYSKCRILRGGSWGRFLSSLRSASRFEGKPGSRDSDQGFRLARDF